jgi:3-phenylpropionate/trans-cinnamate dioxygenase ferredoxin reductase subunit
MSVVIVGAGQAGAVMAATLRQARYRGKVVLLGEEPHLPYHRPPLSKEVLMGRQPGESATLFDRSYYETQGIELRLGVRAVRLDRSSKTLALADGSLLPYEQLILATGLRTRPLRGFDLEDRLFHLRTMDDAHRLRAALRPGQRLLVIGGGLLGLEVVATATQMGCDVAVVERNPTVLHQSVAPVVGDFVMGLHHRHGVRIFTDVTPKRMRVEPVAGEASRQVVAELSDGQTLQADLVVAAIGSLVNTELAQASGLEVQDGIIVNEFGRTSDPSIYAIGDVSRHLNPVLGRTIRVESSHNAQNQAAAIAHVIAGSQAPYAEVPYFWSDQFDMNLQIVGYSSDWDRVVVRGNPAGPRFTVLYLQGNRLAAANTINNGRDIRPAREWIAKRTPLDIDRLVDASVPLEEATVSA